MSTTTEEQLDLHRQRTLDRISRYRSAFSGFVVYASNKQSSLEHALHQAFVPKMDGCPQTERRNESQFSSLTTKNQLELSMVENSLMNRSLTTKLKALMLGSASADASLKKNIRGTKVFSKQTQKTVVTYECRKEVLRLSPEWVELSPECQKDLENIRKNPKVENIRAFHHKYGHVIATRIVFGGAKRWEQASSEIKGDSNESKESNLRASIKADFPTFDLSGSYSADDAGQNKLQVALSHHVTNYRSIGGKSELDMNLSEWVKSLESNEYWEITEVDGIVELHDFIGGFIGMEWAVDAFNLRRAHDTILPVFRFSAPGQIWDDNTSFASTSLTWSSVCITLLFFQDPNDFIKCGGIQRASDSNVLSKEYVFAERIARARRGSPIAVATYDGKWEKKFHLFYADGESQLCRRILTIEHFEGVTLTNWEPTNLVHPISVSKTSNFNLICREDSWYLGFTTIAGETAALSGSLDENDMAWNLEGLTYLQSIGGESEENPHWYSLGEINQAPSRMSLLHQSDFTAFIGAKRVSDNEIVIRILYKEPEMSPPASDDETAGPGNPEDWESIDESEDIDLDISCMTRPQSSFLLFNMQDTRNHKSSKIVFISPEGKMEICQITLDTNKRISIQSEGTIFEPDCMITSMDGYFMRVYRLFRNIEDFE